MLYSSAFSLSDPGKPENTVAVRRPANTLEALVSGKTRTLKASVHALLEEIHRRESLHIRVLESIDSGMSERKFRLERVRYARLPYTAEIWLEKKRLEESIDANIAVLEGERRKEQVECWRDLALLRKYLLSALKDYWELWRRQELLKGIE